MLYSNLRKWSWAQNPRIQTVAPRLKVSNWKIPTEWLRTNPGTHPTLPLRLKSFFTNWEGNEPCHTANSRSLWHNAWAQWRKSLQTSRRDYLFATHWFFVRLWQPLSNLFQVGSIKTVCINLRFNFPSYFLKFEKDFIRKMLANILHLNLLEKNWGYWNQFKGKFAILAYLLRSEA